MLSGRDVVKVGVGAGAAVVIASLLYPWSSPVVSSQQPMDEHTEHSTAPPPEELPPPAGRSEEVGGPSPSPDPMQGIHRGLVEMDAKQREALGGQYVESFPPPPSWTPESGIADAEALQEVLYECGCDTTIVDVDCSEYPCMMVYDQLAASDGQTYPFTTCMDDCSLLSDRDLSWSPWVMGPTCDPDFTEGITVRYVPLSKDDQDHLSTLSASSGMPLWIDASAKLMRRGISFWSSQDCVAASP